MARLFAVDGNETTRGWTYGSARFTKHGSADLGTPDHECWMQSRCN